MSEKDTFQTAAEKQLGKWKAQVKEHAQKIDELKARADKLEAEAKLQYLEQLKELEKKIESLRGNITEGEKRLDSIKEAGEEAWEELKEGSQNAWDNLVVGVNDVWAEIKSSVDLASTKIQGRMNKK